MWTSFVIDIKVTQWDEDLNLDLYIIFQVTLQATSLATKGIKISFKVMWWYLCLLISIKVSRIFLWHKIISRVINKINILWEFGSVIYARWAKSDKRRKWMINCEKCRFVYNNEESIGCGLCNSLINKLGAIGCNL